MPHLSDPRPAADDGTRPRTFRARGVAEYGFLILLILGATGICALLIDNGRSDELRALLDHQQTQQQRLLARLQRSQTDRDVAAPTATPVRRLPGIEQQLNALLEEQKEIRAEMLALNTALAGAVLARDRLQEKLDTVRDEAARGVSAVKAVAATPQQPAPKTTTTAEPAASRAAAAPPPAAATAAGVVTVGKHVPVLRDIPGKGLRLQEIHFSPTSSKLSPGAVLKTRQAAALFKQQNKNRIRLVGFSDTVGDADGNRRVAQRRAAAVAELLVGAGVPRSKIDIVAKGEQNTPLLTGDEVDEPLNRCVGIFAVN